MLDRCSQKIYVHFAGKTTVLRDIPFDATVDDVCASWAALRGKPDLLNRLKASTVKGRALQGCQVISRALGPNSEICLAVTSQQNGDDDGHDATLGHEEASSLGVTPAANDESATSGGTHTPDTPQCRASTSPLIGPLLERAADKEASQHYKSAAFIYDQVSALSLCGRALSTCCMLHPFTVKGAVKSFPLASHLTLAMCHMLR